MTGIDEQLFTAAREGRVDEIRALVQSGADINAVDPGTGLFGTYLDNITPLMVAAGSPRSNAATIAELLAHGADVRKVSKAGVSAAWYATGGFDFSFAKKNPNLLAKYPVDDWGGGDVDRLRLLLDSGAELSEMTRYGRSTISEAASGGDPERLALLLERGASPEPLRYWFSEDGEEGWEWHTPLFHAAASGSIECIRLLLDAGCDPNFSDDRRTALHYASSVEAAEYLWNAGARLTERWGETVENAYFYGGGQALAEFLLSKVTAEERQGWLDTQLCLASGEEMDPNRVRHLLQDGASVHSVNPKYGTPLHAAPLGYHDARVEETIELLIASGAELNLNLPGKGTPLHVAAAGLYKAKTAVTVLLRLGADVNAVGPGGATPLMRAAVGLRRAECIRLLLEAGADPSLKDDQGKTAKDHALEQREDCGSFDEDLSDEPDDEDALYKPREAANDAREAERLLGL